ERLPLAYRLFRGHQSHRQRWTWAFQPRPGADEPLRWSVTPAAKRETTLSQMRSHARFAVLLRRRPAGPETTDALRARVLMDEGWEELSAVLRGGDKKWALNYPSYRRKPARAARKNWSPGVAKGDAPSGVATNDRPARGTGLWPAWRTRRLSQPVPRSCR